ncbi:hypothetical protein ABK040_009868 [Willaertia magna]
MSSTSSVVGNTDDNNNGLEIKKNYNFTVFRGKQEENNQIEKKRNELSLKYENNKMLTNEEMKEIAKEFDNLDELKDFRKEFNFPTEIPEIEMSNVNNIIYFCGNSLGLQPKQTSEYIQRELNKWSSMAVGGHFTDKNKTIKWFEGDEPLRETFKKIVGANSVNEITIMNSLTVNLHLLLSTFYKPVGKKCKILMEEYPFPSDMHAVTSHLLTRYINNKDWINKEEGNDKLCMEDYILLVGPRKGENFIRSEDVIECLRENHEEIALSLIGGVHFLSGVCFDMKSIAKTCNELNIVCGMDLAHAVGNVPLYLHDWNVDFACWCSYKYLNGGPGNLSMIYVNEKYSKKSMEELPRFIGWFGRDAKSRFTLDTVTFDLREGAGGFQISNICPFNVACLLASSDVYDKVDKQFPNESIMEVLRRKSVKLTNYLEWLLEKEINESILEILTPKDTTKRGCQLSIRLRGIDSEFVKHQLFKRHIIVDTRRPDVIRVAPVPLYNQFMEVYEFVMALKEVIANK